METNKSLLETIKVMQLQPPILNLTKNNLHPNKPNLFLTKIKLSNKSAHSQTYLLSYIKSLSRLQSVIPGRDQNHHCVRKDTMRPPIELEDNLDCSEWSAATSNNQSGSLTSTSGAFQSFKILFLKIYYLSLPMLLDLQNPVS